MLISVWVLHRDRICLQVGRGNRKRLNVVLVCALISAVAARYRITPKNFVGDEHSITFEFIRPGFQGKIEAFSKYCREFVLDNSDRDFCKHCRLSREPCNIAKACNNF